MNRKRILVWLYYRIARRLPGNNKMGGVKFDTHFVNEYSSRVVKA